MGRGAAGTRSAVEKDDRLALRVAALFPVHPVPRVEFEHAGAEGLDVGVEFGADAGWGCGHDAVVAKTGETLA